MNSTERREARYQRRKAARLARKQERCEALGGIEGVFTFQKLYEAGKKCCNGVRWKRSVQRFELHLFSRTAAARKAILSGKWKARGYSRFLLMERGKTRVIDAPRIQDRQIEKVYTQDVLLPLYLPCMIYNNGASLKGKGLEFSKRELRKALAAHYRKYGREGWIILTDYEKYFPSADRNVIRERHRQLILDNGLRAVGDQILDDCPGDIGMPLGVEPSQAEMIAYPSAADNFVKCQLSIKGDGHYMDDNYIIVPPNGNPKEMLRAFRERAARLGLRINPSKQRIVPLAKPFRFCKVKYWLSPSGAIVTHGCRDSAFRARRKIRAFARYLADGSMTYEDLRCSLNGTFAYFGQYNDHNKVLRLRRYFYHTFGFSPERLENFRARGIENELLRRVTGSDTLRTTCRGSGR